MEFSDWLRVGHALSRTCDEMVPVPPERQLIPPKKMGNNIGKMDMKQAQPKTHCIHLYQILSFKSKHVHLCKPPYVLFRTTWGINKYMGDQIVICQLLSEHEIRTRGITCMIQIFYGSSLREPNHLHNQEQTDRCLETHYRCFLPCLLF